MSGCIDLFIVLFSFLSLNSSYANPIFVSLQHNQANKETINKLYKDLKNKQGLEALEPTNLSIAYGNFLMPNNVWE